MGQLACVLPYSLIGSSSFASIWVYIYFCISRRPWMSTNLINRQHRHKRKMQEIAGLLNITQKYKASVLNPLSIPIMKHCTFWPTSRCHPQVLNKCALRSCRGHMQQIWRNYPSRKHRWQNIETGREKKKKQTLKIKSDSDAGRNVHFGDTDTDSEQQRHQNTAVHTVLLLFR